MTGILLKEKDMLRPEHFPVIALINEAFAFDAIKFMENINRGIGSGYNFADCSFWEDLDEYDRIGMVPFEGILVGTEQDEEVIVSHKEFLYYLQLAAPRYAAEHPDKKEALEKRISEYKRIYRKYLL